MSIQLISQENLINMDSNNFEFIVGGRNNLKVINSIIDKISEDDFTHKNIVRDSLYSIKYEISYNDLSDKIKDYKSNSKLYVYIDLNRKISEKAELHLILQSLEEELSDSEKYNSCNEKLYEEYFEVKRDDLGKVSSFTLKRCNM